MITRLTILLLAAGLVSGCATGRAVTAKNADNIDGISACLDKRALSKKIGGADRTVAIPGGGHIEINDVLVKPEGAEVSTSLFSLATLGMWDLAESAVSAGDDCDASKYERSNTNSTRGAGLFKCDFKKLRFFVHYADAGADQMACWEMKEVWVGDGFYSMGDESKCPKEYKAVLSKVIDTSDFPTATLSWKTGAPAEERQAFLAWFEAMSVHELLQAMTADNRANCPT